MKKIVIIMMTQMKIFDIIDTCLKMSFLTYAIVSRMVINHRDCFDFDNIFIEDKMIT